MDNIKIILDNLDTIYKRKELINKIIEYLEADDYIIIAIPKNKIKTT